MRAWILLSIVAGCATPPPRDPCAVDGVAVFAAQCNAANGEFSTRLDDSGCDVGTDLSVGDPRVRCVALGQCVTQCRLGVVDMGVPIDPEACDPADRHSCPVGECFNLRPDQDEPKWRCRGGHNDACGLGHPECGPSHLCCADGGDVGFCTGGDCDFCLGEGC